MNVDPAFQPASPKHGFLLIGRRPDLLATILLIILVASAVGALCTPEDPCAVTAHMRIYSNAFIAKGSGDLDGYELALEQHNNSTVDALLYVYEGAATDEGIRIEGRISGKEMTLEGNWVEHLTEYPSKREIVQTHLVKIDGTLDSAAFRGSVKIEGLFTPVNVRLKRVGRLWVCKR